VSPSNFSSSLSAADLNTDGKTDLAVGANYHGWFTGRIYIFYNNDSVKTDVLTADVVIDGEMLNSYFGSVLAAGDFNADARTDLAVGAGNYSGNTGRVYIFYNDGFYPSTASTADAIITGEATGNTFGSSLSVGDFNTDAQVDLAVGANLYGTNAGRVYIFYNDGLYPATASTADSVITGESSNNNFGNSLAVGDFNADGKTDLVVAAYGHNTYTGRVYIFYNDGSYPSTASTSDIAITGEITWSYFGRSLVVGDFNSDGKTDLVVGADRYNSFMGRAYILYNDGSMPVTASTADVTITGEAANSNFGFASTAGDFNADGKIDLVIGAYGYNTNTGRAYIFYNDGSVPATATTADAVITGENTDSRFGKVVDVGDFNADGSIDLVVGANNFNYAMGAVYYYLTRGAQSQSYQMRGDFKMRGDFRMR
jgi:hypothetical protein